MLSCSESTGCDFEEKRFLCLEPGSPSPTVRVGLEGATAKCAKTNINRYCENAFTSPSFIRNTQYSHLLPIMALSNEQVQCVQQQLNYQFRDTSRLSLCFKAAHRSDRDGVAGDENRALATTGVKIMDLVNKPCLPVATTESRDRIGRYRLKTDRADEL